MKHSDKIEYIKQNRHKTVKQIAADLGISTRAVCSLAQDIGIVLKEQRIYGDRSFCAPPYSCDRCPYPDCINAMPATKDETEYVNKALGFVEKRGKRCVIGV